MVEIIFKIDHNKILNRTVANERFCYGNKSGNIWKYYFSNSTNSNVYIAIAKITKSGSTYFMPLLVSKDEDAVKFYVTLNDAQTQTASAAGGSIQYNNQVYYYNKFLMPMQDGTIISELVKKIYIEYDAPIYQVAQPDDAYMSDAAELMFEDEEKYTFRKNEIKNIESLSQSSTDASLIFYGILANSGSIELMNVDNKISDLISSGDITNKPLNCSIYINDKLFQKHKTTDNDYNDNSQKLTLQLSNSIKTLNETSYERNFITNKICVQKDGINESYVYPTNVTLYHLLLDVLNNSGYETTTERLTKLFGNRTTVFNGVVYTLENYTKNFVIDYPYLEKNTSMELLNRLCTAAQLQLIQEGEYYILINARPILIGDAVIIPKNKQYNQLEYTTILKNGTSKVNIDVYKFEKEYSEIYSSDKLKISQDNNGTIQYIGNDSGVNQSQYDVDGGEDGSDYWFQFNYEFNASDLNKIVNVSDDIDIFSLGSRIIYAVKGDTLPVTLPNEYDTKNVLLRNIGLYDAILNPDGLDYHTKKLENNKVVNAFGYITYQGGSDDGKYEVRGQLNWHDYTETPPNSVFNATVYRNYYITSCTFTIKGYVYTINKVTQEFGSGTDIYSKNNNELFQYSKDGNINSLTQAFANNILSDYSDGISNGSITVSYGDYYDENNNKVVNGENGEVLSVGQIVKVEGNDKTWKITGRKLRKKGVPFIDLELMEVKEPQIPQVSTTYSLTKCSMTINRVSSNKQGATIGQIANDAPIYVGDVVKFNMTPNTGGVLETLTINSENYINNSNYTVTTDINLVAVYRTKETVYSGTLYPQNDAAGSTIYTQTIQGIDALDGENSNPITLSGNFEIDNYDNVSIWYNGRSYGSSNTVTISNIELQPNSSIECDLRVSGQSIGSIKFTLLEQAENTLRYKNKAYIDSNYNVTIGTIRNCTIKQYK